MRRGSESPLQGQGGLGEGALRIGPSVGVGVRPDEVEVEMLSGASSLFGCPKLSESFLALFLSESRFIG